MHPISFESTVAVRDGQGRAQRPEKLLESHPNVAKDIIQAVRNPTDDYPVIQNDTESRRGDR